MAPLSNGEVQCGDRDGTNEHVSDGQCGDYGDGSLQPSNKNTIAVEVCVVNRGFCTIHQEQARKVKKLWKEWCKNNRTGLFGFRQ